MEVVFPTDERHPFQPAAATDRSRYRIPADLSPGQTRAVSRVAKAAFSALGCRDFARVVVRIGETDEVTFIACTPLPSLAPSSDLVRIAAAAGLDYRGLIGELMAPALRRLAHRRREPHLGARE
jgi:D-alanine-D-alanine ligase